MRKNYKKNRKKEILSGKVEADIIDKTESEIKTEPEKIEPEKVIEKEDISSLDADLNAFEKTTASFKVPIPEQQPEKKDGEGNIIPEINFNDTFKLNMFFGFACFMLSGFNAFIFDMVSKYELNTEDMSLTPFEKNSIRPYMNNPKILELINKIPEWAIGIVHIEWIFIQKFQNFQAKQKELGTPTKKDKNKKENE